MLLKLKRDEREGSRKGTGGCSLKRIMGPSGFFGGGALTQAYAGSAQYVATSVKYAFNRRLKRDNCPLSKRYEACIMFHSPHLRKDKGEFLYRLVANACKKIHNKNSTRYVESSCTEIHLHALKITMGLGARAPWIRAPDV